MEKLSYLCEYVSLFFYDCMEFLLTSITNLFYKQNHEFETVILSENSEKKKRNGEIIGFRDFNENLYYECLKRFQLHENRNFSFRKDFNSSFFTQPTFTSSYFFQFFFLTETFNKEASFFRGVHIRRPRFNHSIFQQFQQFIHG